MTEWLINKSALVRVSRSPDDSTWAERIERGLVSITAVTQLEVGFSARSIGEHTRLLDGPPVHMMPVVFLTPTIEQRAIEVQRLLADRGQHRAPSIPDLLIAAAAELMGFTLLHVDKDFELISTITGQSIERLVLPEG